MIHEKAASEPLFLFQDVVQWVVLCRELPEHPEIVFEEETDIVDFVSKEHRSVHTHTEGVA